MRARIVDASGRGLARVTLAVLALAMAFAPSLLPLQIGRFAPLVVAMGGILALAATAIGARTRVREVAVRLGFGWIEARIGKKRWRRIEGSSHGGARIARAAEGASLAVARRFRSPLLLELRDEADAKAVQVALGSPTSTGGDVAWAMERSAIEPLSAVALWLGVLYWLAFAASSVLPPGPLAQIAVDLRPLLVVLGSWCILASPVLRVAGQLLRPTFSLEKEGLRIGAGSDAPLVPYVLVSGVKAVGEGLEIQLKTLDDRIANHPRIVPLHGLTPLERAHVATHVLSAARDAQGWGRGRRSETLRALRRSEGEAVAGWLARVDALAPKQASVPYRENVPEKKELAQLLDDPASPRDVRIAAARVLYRIDPDAAGNHTRALEAVAEGKDEARRVQAAVEAEIEEATAAYDELRPAFRPLRS